MGASLSVCMIVRDEEKDLPRCLESIQGIADELIVVDTGSVDNTKAIAKSYGAKVYDFEWVDDFSKARNYSLEKATGDWILILDGDDEFERRDAGLLKELINKPDAADIYIFNTICYIGNKAGADRIFNVNIRLFRNIPEFRYQGRIHESIISQKSDVRMEPVGITIYHYGYLNPNVKEHDKRKRNMRILEQQLQEQPNNPYFLFCMGNEYFALGQLEKSLEYFCSAFEKCNKGDIYVPKLIIRIIMAYQLLKDYDKAFSYIEQALSLYPQFTDAEYIRGTIYHSLGYLNKAIKSFEKCLAMSEPPPVLSFLIGVGSYKPYYALGCIANQLGDLSGALVYFNQVLLAKPDFYDAIYAIGEVLTKTISDKNELKEKLLQYFDSSNPAALVMLADLLFLQKQYDLSLEFAEKAAQIGSDTEELIYLRAQCRLYLNSYSEAAALFEQISSTSKLYRRSLTLCFISLLLQGKHEQAAGLLDVIKQEEDSRRYETLKCLAALLDTGEKHILAEDGEASDACLPYIFEVLEIILSTKEFEIFEKSLELLNCIGSDKVLLMLAKLYNKHGYIDMAVKEILRSIKVFDIIDDEAALILYRGLASKKQAM